MVIEVEDLRGSSIIEDRRRERQGEHVPILE